jgi:hypothetical protein
MEIELNHDAFVWQLTMAVHMALRATKGDENPRLEVAESRLHLIGVRTGSFRPIGRVFDRAGGHLGGPAGWKARLQARFPATHEGPRHVQREL